MKYTVYLLCFSFLLLAGCSSQKVMQPINPNKEVVVITEKVATVETVNVGETFEVSFNTVDNSGLKEKPDLDVTIKDFKIMTKIEDQGFMNNIKKDYIVFDLVVENNSDLEISSENGVSESFFVFHNAKGKELTHNNSLKTNEQTYQVRELKPGEKNEGTIVLDIPQGEQVVDMIMYSDNLHDETSNQYFIDLY